MRVVAIGGGHGLAASLRAVRRYADDVTAIVSVADDGGSSGRLRQAFGIPAPGDLRRCLVALAEEGSPWAEAVEHRFVSGELEGHALGNLMIAGLVETTGDFVAALDELGRLLGAAGRVLPATTEPVVLKADAGGGEVEGQVAVSLAGRITSVSLVPADPPVPPAAVEALAVADQVVIGPGSLFTSILAAVAVPGLRQALAATPGRKIYVANLREQLPETAGYDIAAHVDAMTAHGLEIDIVVTCSGALATGDVGVPVVEADLSDDERLAHDPVRLGKVLASLR